MPRRSLPTMQEAAAILTARRTRAIGRPPPSAGKGLSPLVRDLDKRYGKGPSGLMLRWREIVGPQIAQRTEPVKLVKGRSGAGATLEVRVAGPSAAIIQHQAQDIMARVNLFLGAGAVQKLRIVQGPLRAVAAPATTRTRRLAPLDAAEEAALAAPMADQPDSPLKAQLIALGRGVLRRR